MSEVRLCDQCKDTSFCAYRFNKWLCYDCYVMEYVNGAKRFDL